MKKTVLITGASRGIGRAIAVAFAKAGYNLVITCSKSETELLHLKNDLERDYSVDVLASIGDISDFEYVTQLFSHIEQRFHGVDVLVNNAGISYVGLLTDMTIDEWNHILGVNLTSVFPPVNWRFLICFPENPEKSLIFPLSGEMLEHPVK